MARILLVEDNEMNRDMLTRRLERRGHQVLVAVTGAQGVAMVREHRPDLVLMDMSLPEMDGWEATRRVRADSEVKDTPIIALTAHAMDGDRRRGMEAGCDEYETKPIEMDRLMAKVEQLLQRNLRPAEGA